MTMPDENLMGGASGEAGPPAEEICASCGRPMTRRGPNGECLRCLVALVFLADDVPSPEGTARRARVVPGHLLWRARR